MEGGGGWLTTPVEDEKYNSNKKRNPRNRKPRRNFRVFTAFFYVFPIRPRKTNISNLGEGVEDFIFRPELMNKGRMRRKNNLVTFNEAFRKLVFDVEIPLQFSSS